jgi:uncharacterized membrane protein
MSYIKHRLQLTGWVIPSLYAVSALAAGTIIPRIESHVLPGVGATISISAAMAIYSSIASGMIALTGIVFSMTFVAVQFSATAYSPRLVLWIARDAFIAHALGVFTATFLYAIAALGWIDRSGSGRVPLASAWVVVTLLLASVGMFIGLIHRVGLLQVGRILTFTGDQGRKVIRAMYVPIESAAACGEAGEFRNLPRTQTLLHRGRCRKIQALHIAALLKLAEECGGVIEVVAAVGDTVVESTPLLHVFGGSEAIAERKLRTAIETGQERSFEQDPKYAIRLLVDVAIKALSPAVNDPTTAVQALDEIEDLLLRLGQRRLEIGTFRDGDGELRVVVPFPKWEDFLRLALDEIQSYGATSVQVMRRMKALVHDLISTLPVERTAALRYREKRLQATVARSFADAEGKLEASAEDRQGLGIPREKKSMAGIGR